MKTASHVVVIGGGLSGLSAAVACADAGARVSLFESRPRLGGATWSFERGGLTFDNGQHVYLRCCISYRRFLDRLGTADLAPLQQRLAIPILRPSARGVRVAWIKRNSLPAPANLAVSLLRYSHLSVRDRLGVSRAVLALKRLSLDDPALDAETLGAFLSRHGQSKAAIDHFWNLITLPTVNLPAEQASLALGAKVFRTGLLDDSSAGDVGWAEVPLDRLHVEPAARLIERLGGEVHRRAKVTAIDLVTKDDTSVASGVVVDGEHVAADAVVVAVPHRSAADLLPREALVNPEELERLGTSPIVDVHFVYDRKVTDLRIAAGVDTPVQFVFDKTVASGLDPNDGQVLAVSISGADAEHGERPEVLIDRYRAALGELFPRAGSARVVDAVVSREHEATFRGIPGTAKLRPGPKTGVRNCYLAGAWTDTGWPATMEGATRSGERAAAAVLQSIGNSTQTLGAVGEKVVA